ncbi:MAG TPA: cobaltochelatase subunit CobT, partial [Sphingomicrobium sp.]|nr:cobaltochelatase subunit CobT [Sphingomicrobium sp.]
MDEKVDLFRRALAGAARAIARDAGVEVVFASDNAPASGKTARVVSPGAALEPRLVAEARGAADSAALRLRYHDARLHGRLAPVDAEARSVFDTLEMARVEALGARLMGGVRENLARLTEARVRGDAIVRARTAEEVPLSTAVGLIARERLTGEAVPAAAAAGLRLVAPWIEKKAAAELDALALTLDDQAAFAKLSRRLLEDLDLAAAEEAAEEDLEETGEQSQGDEGESEESAEEGDEGSPAGGDVETRGEEAEDRQADGESGNEREAGDEEASTGDDLGDSIFASPSRRNWELAPPTDYKAFTTRFDEIVEAGDLCDEE